MSVRLDPRTRAMRDLYLKEEMPLRQIGERFGLSGERVRQILKPLGLESHPSTRKSSKREVSIRAAFKRVSAGGSVAEEAKALGYSSESGLRSAFARLGLKLGPRLSAHGTMRRYAVHKCRCPKCREKAQAEHRKRCQRGPTKHGTASAYRNYGCRCVPCRTAERHYQRDMKARARQKKEPVG
jgi:hypothetical protein